MKNDWQIKKLGEVKNSFLLPKLMKGEVRI